MKRPPSTSRMVFWIFESCSGGKFESTDTWLVMRLLYFLKASNHPSNSLKSSLVNGAVSSPAAELMEADLDLLRCVIHFPGDLDVSERMERDVELLRDLVGSKGDRYPAELPVEGRWSGWGDLLFLRANMLFTVERLKRGLRYGDEPREGGGSVDMTISDISEQIPGKGLQTMCRVSNRRVVGCGRKMSMSRREDVWVVRLRATTAHVHCDRGIFQSKRPRRRRLRLAVECLDPGEKAKRADGATKHKEFDAEVQF